MSKTPKPDDFQFQIKELQRRLEITERTPRLPNSSIKDGTLTWYDDEDQLRMKAGKLDENTYGVATFNQPEIYVPRPSKRWYSSVDVLIPNTTETTINLNSIVFAKDWNDSPSDKTFPVGGVYSVSWTTEFKPVGADNGFVASWVEKIYEDGTLFAMIGIGRTPYGAANQSLTAGATVIDTFYEGDSFRLRGRQERTAATSNDVIGSALSCTVSIALLDYL